MGDMDDCSEIMHQHQANCLMYSQLDEYGHCLHLAFMLACIKKEAIGRLVFVFKASKVYGAEALLTKYFGT